MAQPVSVLVDTYGTGTVSDETLSKAVRQVFDLRPQAIIRYLDLRRPIYSADRRLRSLWPSRAGPAWEKIDRVEELKNAVL